MKEDSPSPDSQVLPTETFITHLKEMVSDYEVYDEDGSRSIVQRCAAVVTEKWQSIAGKMEAEGFPKHILPLAQLQAILKSFDFSDGEVELLVGEVAVCS